MIYIYERRPFNSPGALATTLGLRANRTAEAAAAPMEKKNKLTHSLFLSRPSAQGANAPKRNEILKCETGELERKKTKKN